MYRREKSAALFWIIIFAIFIVLTGNVNEQCRMYPYFVCALGVMISALQYGSIVCKEKKKQELDSPIAKLTREQAKIIAVFLLFALGYILCIRHIGYFVTTFAFIAIFSYWQSKTNKKYLYFAVSLIMVAVVYVAFKVFLRVPLPEGILF